MYLNKWYFSNVSNSCESGRGGAQSYRGPLARRSDAPAQVAPRGARDDLPARERAVTQELRAAARLAALRNPQCRSASVPH